MAKNIKSKKSHFDYLENEWNILNEKIENKEKILIKKNCPICKKKKFKILFKKKGLNFVQCNCEAKHVFINPSISQKFLEKHFQNSKSWNVWSKKVLKSNENSRLEKYKYSKATEVIKKTYTNKIDILDVGCASGNFINYCNTTYKWNTFGIEPSKGAYSLAIKKNKKNIYNTNFENFSLNKKFDVISFWASFEYCTDIDFVLKKIKTLLKKRGLLLIYISGNSASLLMRLLKEKCIGFVFNRTHYFSPKSLDMLLSKYKFNRIYQESFISETKEIINYLDYYEPYKLAEINSNSFLTPGIVKQFDKIILKKMMGYKFLTIYKNK